MPLAKHPILVQTNQMESPSRTSQSRTGSAKREAARPVGAGAAPSQPSRKHDAERTRADILAVATEEFAEHGLSGARVDAIAARTRTTKLMLYYYFGSKEGLYEAVLERAYAGIREAETKLDLAALDPESAIRRLVDFTFDHHAAHPEFVRLVCIENIHHAKFIASARAIHSLHSPAIAALAETLERGRTLGCFRAGLKAIDVHLLINSFCFYRVSNRGTFGANFQIDLHAPDVRERHRRMISEAVLGYLKPE